MKSSLHGGLLLLMAVGLSRAHAADDACGRLREARLPGVLVTSASTITPAPEWTSPAGMGGGAPVRQPFCRVQARLAGRIDMELWLPPRARWNGRLLGDGVGGDAGVLNYGDMARGLAAGFATASNDSGHKATEAHWLMRPEAVLDYTHRSQHLMNIAARGLVAAYYGTAPHHAYFLGCSGGGRQALKEIQRYPQDYDGVVAGAGAPAMPEMSARHLSQALYEQRHPDAAMTEASWALVAGAAVRACDADDGVVDGVVEDPAHCAFRPDSLRCPQGQAQGCLGDGQVDTVARFYAPLRDEQGRVLDRGLVPGVRTRPGPPSPLLLPMFGEGAHHDLGWDANQFTIAGDLALVDREMPELRADDADLAAFAARGGKLVMYQGWLDPSVAATYSIDYYRKVRALLGPERAEAMERLYMVPGMFHCRGGAGADHFGGAHETIPVADAGHDLLTALVDWVERGAAPQAVVASRVDDQRVTRQHPLCPFPQTARFQGGDPADAANYRCSGAGERHVEGTTAAGAYWAIDVPDAWNGTLLLYAHGYSPLPPRPAPETAPRGSHDWLLEHGYALAASSYSRAGWALAEAPGDQLDVLAAFRAQVGTPKRTVEWGSSMGGLTTVALAERAGAGIDGALSMCGSVSGSLAMLNTALDGAFAFKTLVAPASDIRLVHVDDDRANAARVAAALADAWKSPEGRARVALAAALAQIPPWTDPNDPEPGERDFTAQAEQARKAFVMGVFLPRVDQEARAGGVYSWNTGVDYGRQLARSGREDFVRAMYGAARLDLDDDLRTLAAAPRMAADPAAVAYMRANYVPSGRLQVPLLTLQAVGDGATVPATHGSLRDAVQAAGRSALLGQAWVRRAGHCTFNLAEEVGALHALERRLDAGRWRLDPAGLAADGSGIAQADPARFLAFDPPPLARSCGATAPCEGEPDPRAAAP